MDGLLEMIIQSADFEKLNVQPGDVLKGKLYVGADGKTHSGEMEEFNSPDFLLELNGSVVLPEGHYTGGSVRQNIPSMGETHITPGSKQISIPTNGVYMAGNIILDKLGNLTPENIKLGEYVGGVGPGEWQGYVVTDPNTFYYRGTFGPGQSFTDLPGNSTYAEYHDRTDLKDRLRFVRKNSRSGFGGGFFDRSIDLTNLKKVSVDYTFSGLVSTSECYMHIAALLWPESFLGDVKNSKSLVFDKYVKNSVRANSESRFTFEVDISGYSREVYLFVFFSTEGNGSVTDIHSVKFI